jgi:beta-N-acetylhexosaminidase
VSSLPETSAFQSFLAQRPALIRNKKIFVFALEAPYYLDSTEVSKIYAYYGVYSKNDSCLDVAARVLFGDLPTGGASPVSIEGIGYDLLTALSPDPDQLIEIAVGLTSSQPLTPVAVTPTEKTPTVSPVPLGFSLGDKITFLAGPILDHNQHPVPDDTLLQFIVTYPSENIPPLYKSAHTKDGMAQVDYVLDRPGELQVSASSEPAKNSVIIKLTVGDKPGFITAIAPTQSEEPSPTSSLASANPTPVTNPPNTAGARAGWDTFLVILLILGIVCGTIFAATNAPVWTAFRWRAILGVLVGGLAGYDLFALGFPGLNDAAAWGGRWLCVVFGILGSAIGAALAWWSVRRGWE